jgi:hypothetical protein
MKTTDAEVLKAQRAAIVEQVRHDLRVQFPIPGEEEIPSSPRLDEETLGERWKKLLYAESVLQKQRQEILDALDDAPDDVLFIRARLKEVIEDQVSRPSPDYRALLVNTRKQLAKVLDQINAVEETAGIKFDGVRNTLKEAIRLTNIEHLPLWRSSEEGAALHMVVSGLIDDIDCYAFSDDDGTWRDETLRDLHEALEKPGSYLARKSRGG